MNQLERDALATIEKALAEHDSPAMFWSGGKDSIVALHLLRQVHSSPAVIFLGHIYGSSSWRWKWALQELTEQNLCAFFMPPTCFQLCQNGDDFLLLGAYAFNGQLLSTSAFLHSKDKRGDSGPFTCARHEILSAPLAPQGLKGAWNMFVTGQRSSDILKCAFTSDMNQGEPWQGETIAPAGGGVRVTPLLHWQRSDVWDYIRRHGLRYQRERYEGGSAAMDFDSGQACWDCLDTRHTGQTVICPKTGQTVTVNIPDGVYQATLESLTA